MRLALVQARLALKRQEVPIGAVLLLDSGEWFAGFNQPIDRQEVTAHAEILVLNAACHFQRNYRLPHSTLFVTLEPCLMCLGAIQLARVRRVVYAASSPRFGALNALSSWPEVYGHKIYHLIDNLILQEEAAALLRNFFLERRQEREQLAREETKQANSVL